jgi:hypothetical protein
MSAIQLSFSLRVSSGVKTVHLLGSWDNYVGQLPLSKDKSSSKGTWKGTFRFQGTTLEPGQRYWYYYIIDGYHVSHNPSETSTVEPTTGRELNILDVPKSKSSSKDSHKDHKSKSSRHSSTKDSHKEKSSSRDKKRPSTLDIAKGRPLSSSQIKAPKPMSPHATRHILNDDYDYDELADHFAAVGVDEYDEDIITTGLDSASPLSSSDSDLSYRSDSSSPSSSMSGYSTPGSEVSSCTCERYGITRKGERVRLDCGGKRCGYDDSCSSSSGSDDESGGGGGYGTRRQGIVVRA